MPSLAAPPFWKSLKAFTLIELLVVLTVIGILATLVLPVVGAMKRDAECTQCANNLKQLAMACILYSNDNENQLPAGLLPANPVNDGYWHRMIWPYLYPNISFSLPAGKKSVYLCPSDTHPYSGVISYGLNVWISPNGDPALQGSRTTVKASTFLLMDYDGNTSPDYVASKSISAPLLRADHSGKVNVARVDASVTAMTPAEIGTPDSNPTLWKP